MGNDGEAMKWSLKKTFSKDDFNLKTQSRVCEGYNYGRHSKYNSIKNSS